MSSKVVFSLIGAGWRSEFYLRIAKALPDCFEISGMLVRGEEKRKEIEEKWGVKAYTSTDTLLDEASGSFVVASVPWSVCPVIIKELAAKGVPILSETPPAPDLQGLIDLYGSIGSSARIQVAEQYHLQPLHAARIAAIKSGKLGSVSQVQVSAAHGYHGVSLMRKMLGIGFENAEIFGKRFSTTIVVGPDRAGLPADERVSRSDQDISFVSFDGKFGVFDFTSDQYFSWIRKPRILVRGERGEILNHEINYLDDFNSYINLEFKRQNAGEEGNLEGYYLKGILMGQAWVYINPYIPARLTDDELAIATCLSRMNEYVQGGPDFYSLAEASQDHYLGMMIDQAIRTGETVRTMDQPWSKKG